MLPLAIVALCCSPFVAALAFVDVAPECES